MMLHDITKPQHDLISFLSPLPDIEALASTGEMDRFNFLLITICSGVTFIIIAAVIIFGLVRHYHNYRRQAIAQPLKKRVVIMQTNALYAGAYKDFNSLGSNTPLVPHVRIEGGHYSNSDQLAFTEYEIPLDKEWEFPRERWVMGRCWAVFQCEDCMSRYKKFLL